MAKTVKTYGPIQNKWALSKEELQKYAQEGKKAKAKKKKKTK